MTNAAERANQAGHTLDGPKLLHEIFERSARQHPHRVAIDVPPTARRARQTRTYAELDRDAARVAGRLGPDQGERVVAVFLGRHDPWLYACQLGVQRAGAAWVGLDGRHPDAALRFVLEDAAVRHAFTDAEGAERLRGLDVPGLEVHEVDGLGDPSNSPPSYGGADDRLAYVIYTSGTTGRPKGVLIEHRSAVALVLGDADAFGLGPGDRIGQGSSPAYDSSVEEVWLAWAVGGTVVPLEDDVIRSGPDLLPWLRRERLTVLCPPPTLLRTLGSRDPQRDLPELRLLYVGGEALDQDLADAWARGRRMVNGYGPTECTVTVTRSDVVPGRAVRIGEAVPGSRALILDEELRPVPAGEEGELCIAGRSLARGYLGRPDLTADRFVDHAEHGRIYRTGDLVRLDAAGQLVYGGRRDTQVKIRGHRVELGEIEVRMIGRQGIAAAACALGADGVLRAFVVAPGEAPWDPSRLRAELGNELPSHMVPSQIERLDALPTTVGGKLDRRALVARSDAAATPDEVLQPTVDGVLGIIARSFADALGRPRGVRPDEDFFEAGGDSVRAATLVSALRDDPSTASLTVRDVYEARTIEGLAARVRPSVGRTAERSAGPRVDRRWRAPAVLVQSLWIAVEAACALALLHTALFALLPAWLDGVGAGVGLVLLPLLAGVARVFWWGAAVALTVFAKRLLVGRYRPGRWSVRGWFYVRHWVVVRIARAIPHGLVQGTEFQNVALRALGARIGRGAHFARGVDLAHGGWDLLCVGAEAVADRDAALELCTLDDGELVVGPVTVGARAHLGVRGGVGPGAAVGEGAAVTALSRVGAGQHVAAGRIATGVPAQDAGASAEAPAPVGRSLGVWTHALAHVVVRVSGSALGPTLLILGLLSLGGFLGTSPADVAAFLEAPDLAPGLRLAAGLGVLVPSVLVAQALVLRWGPRCPTGVHPLRSARQILAEERMRSVEAAGIWLSGTLFWPVWLRLSGARVGPATEVSTIMDVLPEHLEIGGRSFFADGIYLGGPRRRPGTFEVAPVEVGAETFFGNHVVVPCGAVLPSGILVGVCTVADPAAVRPGSAWFGHPAFELPRREIVEVDDRLTFRPGPLRVANRVLWELARFGLPGVGSLFALGWAGAAAGGATVGDIAQASVLCAAGLVLLVLALKWALLGRIRPGQHGLWSCWCSRWDFLYVAWGMLARPVLARLEGTPWLTLYLRAMGLRIGRGAVLGPGFAQVVDPDMIEIGDGATVDTMFQAHSFEDRVLKIDRVRIGADATVGRASVLLYGIDIGACARVAGHSVVMKRERLLPGRRYEGVPTREVGA